MIWDYIVILALYLQRQPVLNDNRMSTLRLLLFYCVFWWLRLNAFLLMSQASTDVRYQRLLVRTMSSYYNIIIVCNQKMAYLFTRWHYKTIWASHDDVRYVVRNGSSLLKEHKLQVSFIIALGRYLIMFCKLQCWLFCISSKHSVFEECNFRCAHKMDVVGKVQIILRVPLCR